MTRAVLRCGRITALLDTDELAWCGGSMPEQYRQVAATVVRHLTVVR